MSPLAKLKLNFFTKSFLFQIGLAACIGFILFTNTIHESYPDEFDNILGGWYLLHGKPLYVGFFTHHNPIAYLLSAVIELFSWQSFVRFRLIYVLFLSVYLLWSYLYLKKRFLQKEICFYIFVILFFAIGATYFWGHMVLADNLAGLFLLPVFVLLFLKTYYKKTVSFGEVITISILASAALLSAMTYSFLIAIIYLYTFFLYFRNKSHLLSIDAAKFFFILGIPYVVFFIYLLITGSLQDYFYQNVIFNQKFYIYNYPRPEGAGINPIRYAIVIAHDFLNNFSTLLLSVKDFNLAFPFNITLAVANTALLIFLILKREYKLAIFTVFILIYANTRTNPLTSSERDYQSSVYILFSFFSLTFVLQKLYEDLADVTESNKKVVFGFLLLLVGIYTFFTGMFLIRKYTDKVFNKYMGTQALIYSRPVIAPIINSVVEKDEYLWIGPFAFEELFYSNGKVPSNYIILLPEFAKSPQIQQEMMKEFNQNKPKVIYFDKQYSIRGYMPEKYGQFFMDFLKDNYITLLDYRDNNTRYVSNIPITDKVDIEAKLFIRKDKKDEVIQKLLQNNVIKEEATK